jgi:hypothetical protein
MCQDHGIRDAGPQPAINLFSWSTTKRLTITAVTFDLRYLLFNCRQPGAYLLVRQPQIPSCGGACARRLRW